MSKQIISTNKDGVVLFVRNAGERIECWYIARPHADPTQEGYASVMHNGRRDYIQKVWNERYKG
jgi:hypothetical protein